MKPGCVRFACHPRASRLYNHNMERNTAPVELVFKLAVCILHCGAPRGNVVAPIKGRWVQSVTCNVHLRLWLARSHTCILLF